MNLDKNKSTESREQTKKAPSLGVVIVLAVAGGVVLGSAGTYVLTRPPASPTPTAAPGAGATPQASTIAFPSAPAAPPQNQFTPAPQPPGPVPTGKVWSVEHGHWHDAPGSITPPPGATPASTSSAVPRIFTPPATPAEKKP